VRVLHVIPAIAPRYGGPSAVLAEMCRALEQQGIETVIASTDADGDGRLQVEEGVVGEYEGIRAIFFARQWSEAFKYSAPLAAWLRANVPAFHAVHIHAVLSHACLAAGRACERSGVPYVVRPLGTLDPWSLGQKRLRKAVLLWAAGRRLLGGAAAIQYTSRQEKALVERSLGLQRGFVIPLGVADSFVQNARPSAAQDPLTRYVLALSRLHPVKGLEHLIDAFGRAVPEAPPAWRLVIAGDGDRQYVERLKRVAARPGCAGRVEFTGWVDGHEKSALLAGASLFAVPSLHESFGLSLLEALAFGVPACVSSGVHLADEIREAGAGWATGLEPHALERTLAEAMRSPDERVRRGNQAAQLARRFAWSRVAGDLADLYRRISRRDLDARLNGAGRISTGKTVETN